MMNGLRLMLITRSRQLLSLAGWLLLLAGVVYLHVGEFILTFCLGGFFPGTSIEVTPLQAMFFSGVSVLLIGYWALVRTRTRRTQRMRHYSMHRPIARRESRIFAMQMAGRDATDIARRRQISALLPSLSRWMRDGATVIAAFALQGFLWMLIGVAKAVFVFASSAAGLLNRSRLTGRRTWHVTAQAFSDFMLWLEPHLWSADAWVELRVREGEHWTNRRLSKYESVRVVKTMVDGWTARDVSMEAEASKDKPS